MILLQLHKSIFSRVLMQNNKKKCDFQYILSIYIIKQWWYVKKLNSFQQETKSLKCVKQSPCVF